MIPPEKGKELVWFGWSVERGEAGPASRTSWAKPSGLELIVNGH